jgi:hypothetical protein
MCERKRQGGRKLHEQGQRTSEKVAGMDWRREEEKILIQIIR